MRGATRPEKLPAYTTVLAVTGMSAREWRARRPVIYALRSYDAGDLTSFSPLLRSAMDHIPGQAELAVLLNVSVPTLHRWASDKGAHTAASLSPLQRTAITSLLAAVLLHDVSYVRERIPSVLDLVRRDVAETFALDSRARAGIRRDVRVPAQAGKMRPRRRRNAKH